MSVCPHPQSQPHHIKPYKLNFVTCFGLGQIEILAAQAHLLQMKATLRVFCYWIDLSNEGYKWC